MARSRYVRVRIGYAEQACIVCGTTTSHDLVVSGVPGLLRRGVPRHDLRRYSLCRTCGTKVPAAHLTLDGATGTAGPAEGTSWRHGITAGSPTRAERGSSRGRSG